VNLAEQRVALVTAVDAVTGVACFEERPVSPKIGDAWVLLDEINLLHGLVWTGTWRVLVTLPPTPAKASEWLDTYFLDLVTAIRGPGFADTGGPITVLASGNDQYFVEITVRSE
jgi:hypothetical protein